MIKAFSALALALSAGLMSSHSMAESEGISQWREGLTVASDAANYACTDRFADDINDRINNLVPDVCAQLDKDIDFENNPHRYENPQSTCDLGLELPGLPSFDGFEFDVNAPDACSVVKNIVGDSVQEMTGEYMKAYDAIDSTLNGSF